MMDTRENKMEDDGFAELDALLSQPMTNVADNGFTLQVMMEAEKRADRRRLMIGGLISLLVFLVSFLLPWEHVSQHLFGMASGTADKILTQPQAYIGLWMLLAVCGVVFYCEKLVVHD